MKNLLLFLFAILFAINAYAQPNTITYQGVLTDNSGALITGTPNITFALYAASSGGSALWTETQNAVTVTNGLFQVELNSVNANWSNANFSGSMWLQITVGSTTLTPRIAFTAGGYSLAGKATSLQIASDAGAGKVLTSDANGNGSWQTASSGWGLTGNSGTTPETNFIGTTDNQSLVFKVNNQKAGEVSSGTNTSFGYQSLSSESLTGGYNTAIGRSSLWANTTGSNNTANGYQSLFSNTTGSANTVNGLNALYSNVANSRSTAIGYNAMYYADNISTGTKETYNTAVGYEALKGSTTAANNTGRYNTAVGDQTLVYNTSGDYNTADGVWALKNNTTGDFNNAFGVSALYTNTTGNQNTAIGYQTLHYNTMGNYNTATGFNALFQNTTGNNNAVNGTNALYANTTGSNNTANGYQAGRYITGGSTANATSSNSVYLGALTKALADGQTNEIVIGYDATGAGSNTVTLGNASILSTILRGNTNIGGSLTVNGNGTSYALPTARGTSGQVLTTDGSGGTSWATAAGGGGGVTIVNAETAITSTSINNTSFTEVASIIIPSTGKYLLTVYTNASPATIWGYAVKVTQSGITRAGISVYGSYGLDVSISQILNLTATTSLKIQAKISPDLGGTATATLTGTYSLVKLAD